MKDVVIDFIFNQIEEGAYFKDRDEMVVVGDKSVVKAFNRTFKRICVAKKNRDGFYDIFKDKEKIVSLIIINSKK